MVKLFVLLWSSAVMWAANTGDALVYNGTSNTAQATNTLNVSGTNVLVKGTVQTAGILSTNPVLSGAGSAAAPGFSFSGDPDTGFFDSAANLLGVAIGGTERWDFSTTAFVPTIDNTYDIGNGATNPRDVNASRKVVAPTGTFATALTLGGKSVVPSDTSLAYSGTNFLIDCNLAPSDQVFHGLVTQNTGLQFTNGTSWTFYYLSLRQDGTGGWLVNTNSSSTNIVVGNEITGLNNSTNAGSWSHFRFLCITNTYHITGNITGYLVP